MIGIASTKVRMSAHVHGGHQPEDGATPEARQAHTINGPMTRVAHIMNRRWNGELGAQEH